ncbi:Calvin cycle CP12 [Micractinium conductrix]|uniref:Calvin cycle CP12 n=1 Tax=Micractinium conductrix TaxID=554055 RepID=A0A2P6UZ25_9CHLO|nr:Calvin cycle CP12 [Micractinium conductrix]|eukprot:PSC67054.1 Calvin cycle CP12 [Micractinium conductrix]
MQACNVRVSVTRPAVARAAARPSRAARLVVRMSAPKKEDIEAAIKEAQETCEGGPGGECAAAWDTVEELSAAASHAKASSASKDPLEDARVKDCETDPSQPECRVAAARTCSVDDDAADGGVWFAGYPPPMQPQMQGMQMQGMQMQGAPQHDPSAGNPGMADPAQLQQLVQLLGAKMLPKQTAVVECPKSMVGRVIGKGGETIKSLQQYTGAMIQIDQSTDPTRVTIAGSPQSLQLAVSMVNDIVRGTFKGFAMLRQIALSTSQPGMPGFGQPQPVYVQGYGFVPPSQVYNPDDPMAAAQMLRSSPPTGPLTPPMTPLRAAAAGGLAGGLTPEAIAALLGQQQGAGGMQGNMGAPGGSQDVLLGQLLGQLAGQQPPQQQPQTMALQQHQHAQMGAPQHNAGPSHASESDQAAIQALLAQAGLLGGGQQGMAGGAPTSGAAGMSAHALPASSPQGLPAAAALMLSATGAPAMVSSAGSERSYGATSPSQSASMPVAAPGSALSGLAQAAAPGSYLGTSPTATHSSAGSGRASPATALAAANPALTTRRPLSDTGSPLGRYGAVGSPSSQGAGSIGAASIGAAAEEALAAKMASAAISPGAGPTSMQPASAVSVQLSSGEMLPPGWAKVTDGQGLVYYWNHATQESSLTRPTAQGQAAM